MDIYIMLESVVFIFLDIILSFLLICRHLFGKPSRDFMWNWRNCLHSCIGTSLSLSLNLNGSIDILSLGKSKWAKLLFLDLIIPISPRV